MEDVMDEKCSALEKRVEGLERQLKVAAEKYKIIADNTNCGLWEYDIASKRLDQSKKLDGKWSENNLVIENYRDTVKSWGILHPDDVPIFDAYCDSMDHGDPHFQYDLRAITDYNTFAWLRYIGSTAYDDNGKPIKVVGKTLDITREKLDHADLVKKATLDPLTHLCNRGYTHELIENILKNSAPNAIHLLYILDIDNFKEINDRWGHLYGDYILEAFATVVRGCFPSTDIFGRIGGDEFVLFCPSVANMDSVPDNIAHRLIARVRSIDTKNGSHISISAGVAVYPKHGRTYDALYRCADIALYQAKHAGKNCYAIYSRTVTYDTNIGETSRKQNENVTNQDEISVKSLANIEKEIFDYAFDVINMSNNFSEAVHSVFSETGKYFDLDHISVIENNYLSHELVFTYSWERKSTASNSYNELLDYCSKHWDIIENRYYCGEKYYIFYASKDSCCDDIHKSEQFKATNIRSMLQFPIFDGEQLAGVIAYEKFNDKEKWSESSITTLSSITKMISGYMLRLRSKSELEDEILYTGTAMDCQQLTYYVINPEDYTIKYISRYAGKLFPNIRVGAKCYEAVMKKNSPCTTCPVLGIDEAHYTYSLETYDEKYDTWFSVSAAKVKRGDNVCEYLLTWSDVTAFLERVTSTDQLTGTLTYEKFKADALKLILGKKRKYSIAFVGIRDFAGINDVFGYESGDDVLKVTADGLARILIEDELICRIKGDDFLLLLTDDRTKIDERIYNACLSIELVVREKYPKMNVSLAIGVYNVNNTDYSISAEIDKANHARQRALKTFASYNYHNIVTYTDEIDSQISEERAIERKMVDSLAHNEFKIYLQPKVDMITGRIAGAEALVRWVDKNGAFIPNSKFIPIFERNGFIIELDKFVYNCIFDAISGWLSNGCKVPLISVNVSRLHLFDEDFPDYFDSLTQKYGIPHELVEIEITESVFFDNTERLIAIISELQRRGFVISMDDFGTGYSTLSLMKSLPVDIIKIDGSFFLQSDLDDKNKAIISSIIHLSKSLNFKIVAEGIETQEQAEYIRRENVDYAQGFLYYRPMPTDCFGDLLKDKDLIE